MTARNKLMVLNALAAAVALSLSACGGGDDDDASGPGPTPGNPTLTGQVTRNMALKNVVVCMDLNANNACDAGEPASAATGEDGRYSLTYDKSAITPAQVAAASLIAPVLAGDAAAATTAVDMANPTAAATTTNYVLKRSASSQGNINPLTTLVQAGVASGMTEAVARENVAVQLALASAKIDSYQDDPPAHDDEVLDTARFAALFVADALRSGKLLEVGDQNAAAAAATGDLINLRYGDASNYFAYWASPKPKAAGMSEREALLLRSAKSQGAALSGLALFSGAALTANGWRMCDDTVPTRSTVGNPSRSSNCDATVSLVSRGTPQDVSGKAMADVVTAQQSNPYNTINAGVATEGLIAALGNASFPAESVIRDRSSVTLGSYISIPDVRSNAGYAINQSFATTLDQLLAAAQASGANLATSDGMLPMGTVGAQSWRSTITGSTSPTTGTVQHYVCDYNSSTRTRSNCVPIGTGTYTITTEKGTRLMRISGQRPTVGTTLLFTELEQSTTGKWVFQALETKPDLASRISGTASRLNGPGWAAMKTQLGI